MSNFVKSSALYFLAVIPVVWFLGFLSMMDGNKKTPEVGLDDLTLIESYEESVGGNPTNESTYFFLDKGGVRAKLVCRGAVSDVSAFTQELSNKVCHQQKQKEPSRYFYSATVEERASLMTRDEYVSQLDAGRIGFLCRVTEKSIDFCSPEDLYIAKTNAWYNFKYFVNEFHLGVYSGALFLILYVIVAVRQFFKKVTTVP